MKRIAFPVQFLRMVHDAPPDERAEAIATFNDAIKKGMKRGKDFSAYWQPAGNQCRIFFDLQAPFPEAPNIFNTEKIRIRLNIPMSKRIVKTKNHFNSQSIGFSRQAGWIETHHLIVASRKISRLMIKNGFQLSIFTDEYQYSYQSNPLYWLSYLDHKITYETDIA